MRRRIYLLLSFVMMAMGLSAQSLVFHYSGGGETVVPMPATWSLSDGKIVVSGGGETVEINNSEGFTVSYRGVQGGVQDVVQGDVNGDGRVDIGDVATIIGLIAGGGGQGHAPKDAVAVDLGLPSGTKWANMNVGAEKPEEYGLFFAWGETTGYTSDTSDGRLFNWASYKWMNEGQSDWTQINKYQVKDGQTNGCWYDSNGNFIGDGKATLDLSDDAARANWGGQWVMPTYEDMVELLHNTTNEWTTENGVKGRRFTSKVNGNSIFLPGAGYCYSSELSSQSVRGHYWSSSVYPSLSDDARVLDFVYGGGVSTSRGNRCYGQSVRPVLKN